MAIETVDAFSRGPMQADQDMLIFVDDVTSKLNEVVRALNVLIEAYNAENP